MTVSSMPAAQARDENDPTAGRRTATDPRPHVRMTTDFFTKPGKLSHVVDPVERMATLALMAAAVGMCDEQGTNGHIRPEAVLDATGLPPQYAKTLMTDNVWHQADHGCLRCPQPRQDHIYVHDYLLHNRSAEQKERTSERRRAAGRAGSQSRWNGHKRPEKPSRAPGRPRKAPAPQEAAQPAAAAVQHPAEVKARARTARAEAAPAVYEPIVLELCNELAEIVKTNGFSVGKIGPAWWKPCEQLLRIGPPNANEPCTPEQVRRAMRWANEDGFWWKNIRSMEQLREKYERLRADAQDLNRARRGVQAVRPPRGAQPPAAVNVPGMAELLRRQMGAAQGGMVKGVEQG